MGLRYAGIVKSPATRYPLGGVRRVSLETAIVSWLSLSFPATVGVEVFSQSMMVPILDSAP